MLFIVPVLNFSLCSYLVFSPALRLKLAGSMVNLRYKNYSNFFGVNCNCLSAFKYNKLEISNRKGMLRGIEYSSCITLNSCVRIAVVL